MDLLQYLSSQGEGRTVFFVENTLGLTPALAVVCAGFLAVAITLSLGKDD